MEGKLAESLFGDLDEFTIQRQEWKGMPEFVQEEVRAYKALVVHFENEGDVEEFAKLTRHNITAQTLSMWYPEIKIDKYMDKRWVDEA